MASQEIDMPSSSSDEEDNSLGNHIVRSFARSVFDKADFLPEGYIDQLITRTSVLKELRIEDENLGVEYRELVPYILHEAKKLFAILVVCDTEVKKLRKKMMSFKQKGISDNSLPLTLSGGKNQKNNYLFENNQWRFLAPVFSDEKLLLDLKRDSILPFIDVDETVKSGAFGEVRKVDIHPAHCKSNLLQVDALPRLVNVGSSAN
jgi:hypothetical protein